MQIERSFGILLHPTSFPGRWGMGALGREAKRFIDWLASTGAKWWQVLPLGPTSYGDSPYQSFSAFAGNPYLIDPEMLIEKGWLENTEEPPQYPADSVNYGWLYETRWPLLRRAFTGFQARGSAQDKALLEAFIQAEQAWLEDFVLFMALKTRFGGKPWNEWSPELRDRKPAALAKAREELAYEVALHEWIQWLFYTEWGKTKAYAESKGIRIIGDMPIFVAFDSSDVWANPQYFYLDADGNPTVVAGVPPDYFSETGQLWGNPLYRWEVMEEEHFAWWVSRIRQSLKQCHLVRIDHFRGFEAYWEIPFGMPNAIQGRWVKAPGEKLFKAVRAALGDAPIIAEDLGVITPEVEALRDGFGFPGMKILQFAFSDDTNVFLPHNYPKHGNVIVYSGTHDNDTSLGWFRTAPEAERTFMRDYLARYDIRCLSEYEVAGALIELAFKSPAKLAVAPLQDVLGLGPEARMNYPGRLGGNWSWRYSQEALEPGLAAGLRALAEANRRA
ncbi:4-alpha-glucanotransferase [Meiothermus sp. CFH 77666]|uniref:4-alpha-glucanotransferase n=1 Tax=Meiothermus sp. CFH 77666 TaxID=2817942 RepID=UPI001AA0A238|nr:4-alpha-glucanotransferase [Meiothermus sp. CFH 77666]MBO1437954.1 4-alpha-glucanotransferase [Meiothermus sp. CFH 77666]